MVESQAPEPLCPITGAAPKRRVQWLSKEMLVELWRYSLRVDVSDQVCDIERFGIWESPTGLLYFDPPRAGDRDFYQRFYGRIGAHDRLSGPRTVRDEFVRAASHIAPGARVLDVGCGEGGFRRYLSSCEYVGLDPNFGGSATQFRAETIEAHAAQNSHHYDAVCAFQVVEHVSDPLGFVRAMVATLRSGGLLLIGVPCWPSPGTDIPNFVINAPPHHLTLWTEPALRALCVQSGLVCRAIEPILVSRHASLLYWMGRFAPKFRSDRLFRNAWSWHLGLLWCYLAARCIDSFRSPPASAHALELLMVAEKL